MDFLSSPLLTLGMLAYSLFLFVRYGGTQWHWHLRLWIFHSVWKFAEYILDGIEFSPRVKHIVTIIGLTESTVLILLLVLILFLDNKRYGKFIFRHMTLKNIALLATTVFTIHWIFLG